MLEAKDEANKMTRRAAKADAKVKDAVREAEKRGAQFDKEDQESEEIPHMPLFSLTALFNLFSLT